MSTFVRMLRNVERRLMPALLSAAGVTLLAAGLLTYAPAAAAPGGLPTQAASPAATAFGTTSAGPSGSPGATSSPDSSSSPSGTPASPGPGGAVATRIVIPALKIDLPVISGANDKGYVLQNGQKANFPFCDVAEYLPSMVQPGQPGNVYIYAHARDGMFLPLLDASKINDGKGMIGYAVLVYTSNAKVYWYTITKVKRHVDPADYSLTDSLPPGEQQLVLQTSETAGTEARPPKLQIAASFVLVQDVDSAEANPTPHPRACS